jgi:transcriptional regulator with XRE-family HTH domain
VRDFRLRQITDAFEEQPAFAAFGEDVREVRVGAAERYRGAPPAIAFAAESAFRGQRAHFCVTWKTVTVTIASQNFTPLHMAQENISQNFTRRLTRLKAVTDKKWEEIATQLGVSREHLYNYRNGKTRPPAHVLDRLNLVERDEGLAPNEEEKSVTHETPPSYAGESRASELRARAARLIELADEIEKQPPKKFCA